MRRLTFKGFLTQYVKKLSFSNTLDLERLTEETLTSNARLQAPLVLYALVSGKEKQLQALMRNYSNCSDMQRMVQELSSDCLEEQLAHEPVPDEYGKVWNSFVVARDAPKRDDDLKAAMRKKILSIQKEKNCSNYRVYTDLHLNPGNINNWLKNGDCTKVSYHTAERVMNYVVNYA